MACFFYYEQSQPKSYYKTIQNNMVKTSELNKSFKIKMCGDGTEHHSSEQEYTGCVLKCQK